jgi:transposase
MPHVLDLITRIIFGVEYRSWALSIFVNRCGYKPVMNQSTEYGTNGVLGR